VYIVTDRSSRLSIVAHLQDRAKTSRTPTPRRADPLMLEHYEGIGRILQKYYREGSAGKYCGPTNRGPCGTPGISPRSVRGVHNYSIHLVPALYPLDLCIYTRWLDRVRVMLYPDDLSRQRRLLQGLSQVCPRPVCPRTRTYTLCAVPARCREHGQSVGERQNAIKLQEYVKAVSTRC
jgi:hypothetical protein